MDSKSDDMRSGELDKKDVEASNIAVSLENCMGKFEKKFEESSMGALDSMEV